MNIVELRIEQSNSNMETHSCRLEFWNLMLSIGEAFGWKPLGTSYLPTSFKAARGQQTPRHDYRPGEWSDAKRVETEDASAWGAALRVALDSPHLDNMLLAQQGCGAAQMYADPYANPYQDGSDIRDSINDFIGLLQQGALLFAAADVDDTDSRRGPSHKDHATRTASNVSHR